MDSSDPIQFDILTIYKRFCELKYGNIYACGENVQRQDDNMQNVRYLREALAQLLKLVESKMPSRNEILDELPKLMQRLNLMADFSEFSRFYDFVFFICRENGQKNITVSKAIIAWRFVLAGRFRLLNQWCDFVERNQRYNISEDTWQQVLAFSHCVHETLEGYDPEGAWPVLIDDFVENMYRISGSTNRTNFCCTCDDSESYEDSLPGLKGLPGLKRKFFDDGVEPVDVPIPDATDKHFSLFPKRWRQNTSECTEDHDLPKIASDDLMDMARHSSPRCSKPPCAVEGSLSKGFAGLFTCRSYMI